MALLLDPIATSAKLSKANAEVSQERPTRPVGPATSRHISKDPGSVQYNESLAPLVDRMVAIEMTRDRKWESFEACLSSSPCLHDQMTLNPPKFHTERLVYRGVRESGDEDDSNWLAALMSSPMNTMLASPGICTPIAHPSERTKSQLDYVKKAMVS